MPKAKKISQKKAAEQQEMRSASACKAALARWSKKRPPSQRALKARISKIPTARLTVEHYADRPNPQLSWAAAILKRERSTPAQRREAALIFSQASRKNGSTWNNLSAEQRTEIARRGGVRRWEIWRENQKKSVKSRKDKLTKTASKK